MPTVVANRCCVSVSCWALILSAIEPLQNSYLLFFLMCANVNHVRYPRASASALTNTGSVCLVPTLPAADQYGSLRWPLLSPQAHIHSFPKNYSAS